MKKYLFFHKYAADKEGNPLNSVICKTECIKRKELTFNGQAGMMRTQGSTSYCLLIITDELGATVDPRQFEFESDQELVGVVDSGAPVLNRDTGEPSGLTWAEPAV